jgi:hypothetical protein
MKEIQLTKGFVTLVDDKDFEYLSGFTWHALDNHGKIYARTAKKVGKRVICTYMHRMLIECPAELEIDHIDRNPLNNQRSNLRVVTHSENLENRVVEKNPYCPKCGELKYGWYPYCKDHYAEYQREYRKRDYVKVKATEYKRRYRAEKAFKVA